MDSEFITCFEVMSHELLLQNFISTLGIVESIVEILKIDYNNVTIILFSKNKKYSKDVKHMELK